MADARSTGTIDVDPASEVGFKSPLRILARAFRQSRDRWKAKYMELRTEMRRWRNRAADATKARDRWREQAEQAKAKIQQADDDAQRAIAEAERLRTEATLAQARIAELEAAQKKRR
jgi:gas vesicle protein